MSTFAQEKMMRAHLLLIREGGDYADYFTEGASGMWALTNESDKDAAQALLDAKVASMGSNTILKGLGPENNSGEGPSDFAEYQAIHYDDSVSGADYRTWFYKDVDGDAKYYKADNGNSDSIVEIVDSSEISTLLTDSGFDPSQP
tara:strand:+ start:1619 stop:2053 length:435 start_codon:yes stop_codon:yes gene_type:complete